MDVAFETYATHIEQRFSEQAWRQLFERHFDAVHRGMARPRSWPSRSMSLRPEGFIVSTPVSLPGAKFIMGCFSIWPKHKFTITLIVFEGELLCAGK